jgi:hypothetical protein
MAASAASARASEALRAPPPPPAADPNLWPPPPDTGLGTCGAELPKMTCFSLARLSTCFSLEGHALVSGFMRCLIAE